MKIAYSQCWEDASIVIKALQIDENDIVLSITSGGCNTLAIASYNPTLIYSVDSNCTQNFLLELKLAAIQNLSKSNALAFLGYNNCNNRYAFFLSIMPFLDNASQQFWIENPDFIEKGIVHCGKFEKYIRIFRRYILPMIHVKKTLFELVKPKSKAEQAQFYKEKWDTLRWRFLFKIFFSRAIMIGRGRIKQMFAHSKRKPVASIFFNRVKQAFMNGIVNKNFYLYYILFNAFDELPLYIENIDNNSKEGFKHIKIANLNVLTFLKSVPDNSISKFNLSDVFEPILQEEMDLITDEIYRVAKPNARLIFWNNMVYRNINKKKVQGFVEESELARELKKQDKIFFYERFFIYSIVK